MNDYSKEIDLFNACVENAATLSLIVRDSDLQRGALAQLIALAANVEDWKRRAISKRDENGANLFLGCECVIEALSAELNMWLLLKNSQPDHAWNSLIIAQMATRDAMRADFGLFSFGGSGCAVGKYRARRFPRPSVPQRRTPRATSRMLNLWGRIRRMFPSRWNAIHG